MINGKRTDNRKGKRKIGRREKTVKKKGSGKKERVREERGKGNTFTYK